MASLALPLLLGAEWRVYTAVGAARALLPAVRAAPHEGARAVAALGHPTHPTHDLDLLGQIPYMLQLRERHSPQSLLHAIGALRDQQTRDQQTRDQQTAHHQAATGV